MGSNVLIYVILCNIGINAPTSQSLANYVLLAIVYGGVLISRRNGMKVSKH
ncbi:putative solute carrier family 35 member SLC35F1/F2/F6 [Helianthus annuus]|nr:putative solute carrier family 35 member SLC35F1/F2/F6 [Helianthus annuus]KAJ0778581.1 putative solute carrier family 35 member SLC35F1/F2/F6 [Helianthus annuus]KAJ0953241.1 putative solute carrier family 35 member SLC35F1/F2/F6 [Helianthus annuus]